METLSVFTRAATHPRAEALITPEATLDYATLAERVARRATALAQAGLFDPRTPLALVPRPTLASLECLLACFAFGVPVLVVHPRLPAHEAAALAQRARATAPFAPDTTELDASPGAPLPSPASLDPEAPLALVPTSGSTGARRVVVLSRRAFLAAARASARNLPLAPGDRWLLCLPLAHVGGLSIVTRSLIAGSAVVLFEPGPRGLLSAIPELAACLGRDRPTVASLVPALLDALLDHDTTWPRSTSLRAVLLGGAAASERLVVRARALELPVLTTYGLTEACSQVTTTRVGHAPAIANGLVSAGHPLPGIEVSIRDDGRIRVRGANLCSGYLDGPAPMDGDWLLTDDLGRLDEDGQLFVVGRASERLVTGGENVDPRLVEAVLESVPGVQSACVFGVSDERFGETVACALVPVPDAFDVAAVKRALAERLALHERPRRVALLPTLPLNATGKLDRRRTQAIASERLQGWDDVRGRAREPK